MCALDIKDQFLHVPINPQFTKYLRFAWLDKLLEWKCLPFGLRCSPRVVTKILRPVMAFLRTTFSILVTIYIDDILVQASTQEEAFYHAKIVSLVLMALGWSINWEKSNFVPSQEILHLGFIINTNNMTVKCPQDKVARLQTFCKETLKSGLISGHDLEKMLGTMESLRPVVPLAALHYRALQRQLLHCNLGERRPAKLITLTKKSLINLTWWVSRAGFASNCTTFLREPEPTLDIWTDASMIMGGGHNSRGQYFQREWEEAELDCDPSINLLETRAAKEAVKNLASPGDIIRLHIDNKVACSYVKRQGGTKSNILCQEALSLWEDAKERGLTLLAPQWLGSTENVMADFLTRNKMDHWEICLDWGLFNMAITELSIYPTLDAFASRLSTCLPRYMSLRADNQAVGQDAMLHQWDRVTYLFPPVPLIMRVLQKLQTEPISALIICPMWPSAMWWPLLQELLVQPVLQLPHYQEALVQLNPESPLPYLEPLIAARVVSPMSRQQ